MDADGLYAVIIRATLVAAVILGVVAGATAFTVGAPLLAVWVGVAAAAGMYAVDRLRRFETA